jgi:hypothetical protein
MIPVRLVRSPAVILARPWRAIAFISGELSAEDLRELAGKELVATTLITTRVARRWLEQPCDANHHGQQPDAGMQLQRELARVAPGWVAIA